MSKVLYMHMGTGKTGSSALQSSFAKNIKRLAELGVLYLPHGSEDRAASGMITSGNAGALAACLSVEGKNRPLYQLDKHLKRSSKSGLSVLLSNEGFNEFEEQSLAEFKNILDKNGYDLRCIYYARSIAGYALSSYSQRVKRHQYSRTFSGYLRLSFHLPFSRVENTLKAFGRDCVSVYNYDVNRAELDKHFYETVLGLEENNLKLNKKTVNRSLTAPELQFLRTMNRSFDEDRESRFVSDSLIYAYPEMETKPRISEKDLEYIKENHTDNVNFINDLIEGGDAIDFIDDSIEVCQEVDSMQYNHFQNSLLAVVAALVKSNS